MKHPSRPVIIWLLTGCILVYAMVVIGGITRLTHSGLSMVEWNMIVGSMPPVTDADWQVPFEKYKTSPEYKLVNSHFTLEEFKSIYWWEYIHRFLGRLIGMVFLVPFGIFLLKRKISPPLLKKLLILLALGALQGVIGWYMVKSGLNKVPRVSHYRLATHLISAFMVFGATLWVALGLIYPQQEQNRNNKQSKTGRLKTLSIIFFIVIVLQIIYGAFVAGLKAGYLCPTWPKMCGVWIHESVYAVSPLWRNFLEEPMGVQFIHRYLAYLVFVMAAWLFLRSRRLTDLDPAVRQAVHLLFAIVLLQFILGVLTILYSVPVWLGVLHQTGAFLLFSAAIFLLHRLNR